MALSTVAFDRTRFPVHVVDFPKFREIPINRSYGQA